MRLPKRKRILAKALGNVNPLKVLKKGLIPKSLSS
jgi:hypothetical protein